jgi:hypothetical protein
VCDLDVMGTWHDVMGTLTVFFFAVLTREKKEKKNIFFTHKIMRNEIVFYVLVTYAPVSPFVLQTSHLHTGKPCNVPLFPSRFPLARLETPVGRRNGRAAYLMAVEQ